MWHNGSKSSAHCPFPEETEHVGEHDLGYGPLAQRYCPQVAATLAAAPCAIQSGARRPVVSISKYISKAVCRVPDQRNRVCRQGMLVGYFIKFRCRALPCLLVCKLPLVAFDMPISIPLSLPTMLELRSTHLYGYLHGRIRMRYKVCLKSTNFPKP